MDRITKSLMEDFIGSQGLTSIDEPKDFEKFANYSVITSQYQKLFDIEYVTVGDGGDTAIDGIAIIVNGSLIENTDEIDDLIERNGSLEVEYIFIQAKTSANFDSGDIGKFLFGVNDFFSETPQLVRNQDITDAAEISDYLLTKAPTFRRNPKIKLAYVTTGNWQNDTNINAVLNTGKADLERKNLFSTVTITPYGATEIVDTYRKSKEANSTTFQFSSRITLPSIQGVTESYIGLVPFSEFKKIVADEDEKILNVFEDNVRDFQGDTNDVNKGISETINGPNSDLFSVLNNGITIVASTMANTGDSFTINDYQIVNGCQTSNVLYNHKDSGNMGNINIPVKIIATENEDVKNQITLATNNQTPIKKEQLAALTRFQRGLEQYYATYEGDQKLYYERRSKQYNTDTSVVKKRIITIPQQIKSFSAMFLDNPHLVTSFFGSIVKKLNNDESVIFSEQHKYIAYYTAGLALYKLESLFRRNVIDRKYKKLRYHILMLFRMIAVNEPVPFFNSKKIETFCNKIIKLLNDDKKTEKAFKNVIKIIESSDFDLTDKQHVKLKKKTDELKNKLVAKYPRKVNRKKKSDA